MGELVSGCLIFAGEVKIYMMVIGAVNESGRGTFVFGPCGIWLGTNLNL